MNLSLEQALKYATGSSGALEALRKEPNNPEALFSHAEWLAANGKQAHAQLLRDFASGVLQGKATFHHSASDPSVSSPGAGWEFNPYGTSYSINPMEGSLVLRHALGEPSSVAEKKHTLDFPERKGGQLNFTFQGLSYERAKALQKELQKEGALPAVHPQQAAKGDGTWAAGWVKKENPVQVDREEPQQVLDDKLPWEK